MHIFSFHIYFLHYCRSNLKRWFLIAQNHGTKVNKKELVIQENLRSEFLTKLWFIHILFLICRSCAKVALKVEEDFS